MQTKMLGCLIGWLLGWLLVESVALGQALEAAPPQPAPEPAAAPLMPGNAPHAGPPPPGCSLEEPTVVSAPCFWVGVEGLLWWVRNGPLPIPLLTENANPTAFPTLTTPGTQVIFGSGSNRGLNFRALPGGRVILGSWLDPDRVLALEGTFFLLAQGSTSFTASSPGDTSGPSVGVPFFAVAPLILTPTAPTGESALAAPFAAGFPVTPSTFQVTATTQLYGGEANFIYTLDRDAYWHWDFILGYRNLDLQESLALSGTLTDTTDGVAESFRDSFSTRNVFNGVQFGTRGGFAIGRWLIEGSFKLGLGTTSQTLTVSGSTKVTGNTLLGFPAPGTYNGGLFAQPSNIGTYHSSQFTAVPEFQVQASYAINSYTSVALGLNLLYWSNTLRPGNQIDRNIDPNQSVLLHGTVSPGVDGPYAPLVPLIRSDFFAAGLNLGVEIHF